MSTLINWIRISSRRSLCIFCIQNLIWVFSNVLTFLSCRLGQLDEHGNSKAPSPEEEMTPDQAWTLARQTGCDIFSERVPRQWECLETDLKEWKKERLAKQGFEFYHDFMKEPYSPEMLLEENKDDDDVEPAPKFISPSAGPPIPKLDKKGKPIKPIEGQ